MADAEFEKYNKKGNKILFKVNESGCLDKVSEGEEVSNFKLDTNDIFVLDDGVSVYEWIGENSSR